MEAEWQPNNSIFHIRVRTSEITAIYEISLDGTIQDSITFTGGNKTAFDALPTFDGPQISQTDVSFKGNLTADSEPLGTIVYTDSIDFVNFEENLNLDTSVNASLDTTTGAIVLRGATRNSFFRLTHLTKAQIPPLIQPILPGFWGQPHQPY